jgi:hypothetical protein
VRDRCRLRTKTSEFTSADYNSPRIAGVGHVFWRFPAGHTRARARVGGVSRELAWPRDKARGVMHLARASRRRHDFGRLLHCERNYGAPASICAGTGLPYGRSRRLELQPMLENRSGGYGQRTEHGSSPTRSAWRLTWRLLAFLGTPYGRGRARGLGVVAIRYRSDIAARSSRYLSAIMRSAGFDSNVDLRSQSPITPITNQYVTP